MTTRHRAAIPAGRLGAARWHLPGLMLAYALSWLLLFWISHQMWFLPAGLRLGALWLTPVRHWRWLLAGEWLAIGVLVLVQDTPVLEWAFLATDIAPWLIYALMVRLARGPGGPLPVDDPRGMLMLLTCGLLAAALVSPLLQLFQTDLAGHDLGLAGVFSYIYGDFIGQLVVAPILMLLARDPGCVRRALMWRDIGLQLLFSFTVFWLIRQRHDLAPYILLLAFAPIFSVSFRQGWQGAAISVALVGVLIEGLLRLHMVPVDMRVLQLALAVVGAGGLVLGAASSELRRSHGRLATRHRELAQANLALTGVAGELRDISQRLVRLEEQGQRELAVELDHEFGHSIHALSTRISLAFRDVRDENTLRLLESVREQVREMQDSLRRVLRQLRPQVLDTHGLREAVGFGPLRDTLDDAGIGFDASFRGRVEALSDDARTTVYRICQAAVREASRSQSCHRLRVGVDVASDTDDARLEVSIQIDIESADSAHAPGDPPALAAITDRVLAQQGSYRVEALNPGVRHVVVFAEDPIPAA